LTHTFFERLPIVDVSGLRSPSLDVRSATAADLGRAARECGFFYATGHGLPDPLITALIHHAQTFFALPTAEKMRWYIGLSPNHRGYVPEGEETFAAGTYDRKEAFDLCYELPALDPSAPTLGPNVWPDLPGFEPAVRAYYQAAFALGHTLLHGFALALGLPEAYFDRFVTQPPSQLRLIHYPYLPEAVDAPGIGAHTDYECFTILLPTAPGLEVMNGAGVWIDAPPIPGAVVINLGDMLETFTNGELVATSHRVRKVQQERYSFPLFYTCDYHTVVEPLPPFVSAERPARYPALVAGDHLFAQTAQSFAYLKQRLERGELRLPDGARPLSSFGQEARSK
jgi:isopenicillin N synthase-like dioxygenase